MRLRHYEIIIFFISLLLGYEYLCLNNLIPFGSIIKILGIKYLHYKKFNYSPSPGYPISYFLGWSGMTVMLISNFYIIRKRLHFWEKYGTTAGWLDFHIFCGLLGPILIIFHSNFKVNGLVAISFWSMMICSSSGIIGRYFYIQTLKSKEDGHGATDDIKREFEEKYEMLLTPEQIEGVFKEVLDLAGVDDHTTNPFMILWKSINGDFNLAFNPIGKDFLLADDEVIKLKRYGKAKRQVLYLNPFNKLLGYWHSFHLPFAIFMYIVAVIHILTALLLGVRH